MITLKDEIIFWPRDVSKIKTYGLHDVHFGITLFANNIPIFVPPVTAGQRKLVQKGTANTNTGTDKIKLITHRWRNNTTKNEDPETITRFIARIDKVKTVKILDTIPDNIYYKDGQARSKEQHVIV
jgi:hypothetical protein